MELLCPAASAVHAGKIKQNGCPISRDFFIVRFNAFQCVSEYAVCVFIRAFFCIECIKSMIGQAAAHALKIVMSLLQCIQKILITGYVYSGCFFQFMDI